VAQKVGLSCKLWS